ncbi:hypothetical protein [Pantoea ananatis]|uniref:hypothetical protein n=1 Tax=Pantoea ananas TaxID=553 RepID=UPI00235FC394|nr:hypothetical protein [Pantoea ananatis]
MSSPAKLPLSEKQPGYREGTALSGRRFPADGREAAIKRSGATYLWLSEGDAAGRGGTGVKGQGR